MQCNKSYLRIGYYQTYSSKTASSEIYLKEHSFTNEGPGDIVEASITKDGKVIALSCEVS